MTPDARSTHSAALRRAVVGVLCGAAAFIVLSIGAHALSKELTPLLCRVSAPDRPFPSGACIVLTALASALKLGPLVLAGRIPGLGPIPTLWFQAGSAIVSGILAGGLVFALGERKGALVFMAVSAGAIAVCSVFLLTIASW